MARGKLFTLAMFSLSGGQHADYGALRPESCVRGQKPCVCKPVKVTT
ncbi:hypothetical protein BN133_598 [Cronobacter dublinensis 582]|nr:hypothetical protein BN133_598 [Cronobacter dublinensis 582]